MELGDFTYVLQNPREMTVERTSALGEIISKYPYFQPARALYLKGLKNQESSKYNDELKVTAAYTTDRSILFDFITSEIFNQNEVSQMIKQNSESLKNIIVNEMDDISVNKSVAIDDALKQYIKDTEGVLDPFLFQKKMDVEEEKPTVTTAYDSTEVPFIDVDVDNIESIPEVPAKEEKKPAPEITLNLGKPLEFDKTETHSFSEWLKITSFKPIVRENKDVKKPSEDSKKSSETVTKKFELIDKFLESNPKIIPSKEPSSFQLVQNDDLHHDGYMTETLARIYVEQKNYDKAIQSYKILCLKYPEKSSFFADQIRAVKQLQENNNKE